MSPSPHPLRFDPAFARLKEHLIAVTGLAYYADKDDDLAMRVARRLAERGVSAGCAAYLALIGDAGRGESELDALIADLTIGETFFFRHAEMFAALRDVVVPDLLARNRASRQLRIWSAGCSIGAEAYSVAILLRRDFAAQLAGWELTILGTDINREFLARAREGRFEEWALRNTPEEQRRACFVPSGNAWVIAPQFREGVSFQYHNLVVHPFPSLVNNLFAFDLILCRNVAIYFSPAIVRRVVGRFHACLVDGGWLSVGHAEPNTEVFGAFRTVNTPGAVLYQKGPAPVDGGPLAERADSACPLAPRADQPEPWAWSPPPLPEVPETFTGTPALRPNAPPADLAAIRALADHGAWEEADRACRRAQAADKLEPRLYFYHALVLEQMGHHADAERALRQSIYLDRRFTLAHYYLGLLMQKQGRDRQAARSFENVLQLVRTADAGTVFAEGDGLTAGELHKLTRMHLDVLEGA